MIRYILTSLGLAVWRVLAAAGGVIWTLVRPGLRFISAVLLVAAIIALTMDVTRWQTEPDGPLFQSLAAQIRASAPATLDGIGKSISNATHPLLWDPLLTGLLNLPAWLILMLLSVLLAYAARERRQIEIFTN
jgi:hypothetical protein